MPGIGRCRVHVCPSASPRSSQRRPAKKSTRSSPLEERLYGFVMRLVAGFCAYRFDRTSPTKSPSCSDIGNSYRFDYGRVSLVLQRGVYISELTECLFKCQSEGDICAVLLAMKLRRVPGNSGRLVLGAKHAKDERG